MIRLILIRHGETIWNLEQRYQGQKESPLSEFGLLQAQKVGEYLANEDIQAVYSSDLERAIFTAEQIAQHHHLTVTTDPLLREMAYGVWEGMTRTEIIEAYPEQYYARYHDSTSTRIPNGELPLEVVQRFQEFLKKCLSQHENGNIVIVSHGGSLRLILAHLLHIPLGKSYCLRIDNAAISELHYHKKGIQCQWEAHTINSTGHLVDILSPLKHRIR